ncbi:MAG TPA: DUF3027 domain-containing protein [Pseudonocardiaceae bacterium]|nr:DUF3027 domain-containing protein [Pseudonocardiaceae bacterium]
MTPTPNSAVPGIEPDPVLAAAVDLAYAAATEEAGPEPVGRHVGVEPETGGAATHLFETNLAGYQGWRWAVTVASAGPGTSVTVSEVVLLPGPEALVAPEWVPWQQRVQAGDLGVGDLMPTALDDPRLVPAYLESDDPAIEDVATDVGLGRVRVMSRFGRLDSAERWHTGQFGPHSDMARSAPHRCGRCGFYLPLDGSLRAAFGVCGNELSPADGHAVHVEYGCGAHSEIELELVSPIPVVDLVYDDTTMDLELVNAAEPEPIERIAATPEPIASTEPVVELDPAELIETAPEAVAEPVVEEPVVEPVMEDDPVVAELPAPPVEGD